MEYSARILLSPLPIKALFLLFRRSRSASNRPSSLLPAQLGCLCPWSAPYQKEMTCRELHCVCASPPCLRMRTLHSHLLSGKKEIPCNISRPLILAMDISELPCGFRTAALLFAFGATGRQFRIRCGFGFFGGLFGGLLSSLPKNGNKLSHGSHLLS